MSDSSSGALGARSLTHKDNNNQIFQNFVSVYLSYKAPKELQGGTKAWKPRERKTLFKGKIKRFLYTFNLNQFIESSGVYEMC